MQSLAANGQQVQTQGKIVLCSSPSTCNNNTSQNYTYNSTIYIQVNIQPTVTTMSGIRYETSIGGSRL